MKIFIERTKETIKKDFFGKTKDLLDELDINPEIVLVSKNGELVTEEDELQNSDKVKILSVISGG